MGYFIAYRHTGADPDYLAELMPVVRDALLESGQEVYCTYFDEANFKSSGLGPKQIMDHAFQKIDELGGLFVLIDGPDKSDGQIMEMGYCIAKTIPFVVAKRSTVTNTYVHEMTNNSFIYDDMDGLRAGIKALHEEK